MSNKDALLKTRRIYQRDIAEHAGVSISTVSRVLSDAAGISESVRQHVLEVAGKLGYEKTDEGKGSQLRNVMLLSNLPLAPFIDPFHADVLNGVEAICSEEGIHLSYASISNGAAIDDKVLARLQRSEVDGVLLLSVDDVALVEQIQRMNIPVVMINVDSPELAVDAFLPDNYQGARLAMRTLLENGHERILHITQTKRRTIQRRTEAYQSALADAGIRYDPRLVIEVEINPEETYMMMGKRLAQAEIDFTAVFCANDLAAMGFMRAAQDAGLRIPEDVSVIGFDDVAAAAFLSPPLTTIRVSTRELASLALRRLIDRAANPDLTPVRVALACALIERRSVSQR